MKPAKIEDFQLDARKDNEVHYGYLYNLEIVLPFQTKKYQKRMMRVWVPGDFDINKEYGVLYMSDGQNAVDEKLTAYGEWDMEDHFRNLEKQGYPQFIIVGIDCPANGKARAFEYLPAPNTAFQFLVGKPLGKAFGEYLVEEIVPFINSHFKINPELVGFCGSSMGGLISFYICSKYKEIFKFCVSFSPAFHCYKQKQLLESFQKAGFDPKTFPIYSFYMGGGDKLERELKPECDYMVSLLKEAGFDETKMEYRIDMAMPHHEKAWSKHIEASLRFVLDRLGYRPLEK